MSAKVAQALTFVAAAFRDKRRKVSGSPYVTHLVAVMDLVARYGGTEDELVIALLHDYLEDIEGSEVGDIESVFGVDIAGSVLDLTDARYGNKGDWFVRKKAFLDALPHMVDSSKLVCAADKIHNVRSIIADHAQVGDEVWGNFKVGKSATLLYYTGVWKVLSRWGHPIVTELAKALEELEGIVHGEGSSTVEGDGGKPRSVPATS